MGGCALGHNLSHSGMLVLKPQITNGLLTQTVVPAYNQSSIQHLVLKLFAGGQDTGISKTLLNAQLDNPVVFTNLKANTLYRIKAYAYASTDNSLLISADDVNSWTDVTLTNDDRPTIDNLKVKLIDRPFDGQATSSLNIIPGIYTPVASEGMAFPFLGTVSTLAGNGSLAFSDGFGTAAMFNHPISVAVDPQGNVFVADSDNHRIRKITPGGFVSTFAGNGSPGLLDGTGTAASFNNPHGLTFDLQGNLFVAEWSNHCIRKITPNGVVTLFAGNGTSGFVNASGLSARFNSPVGLTVDDLDNIYVAEHNTNRIRKITSTGVVTTFAGNGSSGLIDGTAEQATFDRPVGIARDSSGNFYVADHYNNAIRKITSAAVVTTLAGNGTASFADGSGANAMFNHPYGLTVDSKGTIYVADQTNNRIRKVTADGVVSTFSGSGAASIIDGPLASATFNMPNGIFADSFGNIYVADRFNHRIRRIQ